MKNIVMSLVAVVLSFLVSGANPPSPDDGEKLECRAAVLVYHQIVSHKKGETRAESYVRTSPEAFAAHMQFLADGKYSVVPYSALADCLEGIAPMPPKAVIITFDDGLATQYTRAYPILKQHGFTATFFVVTKSVGQGRALMSWDQLREMRDAGMTIGSHTRTHPFLTRVPSGAKTEGELTGSRKDIERELGEAPEFLAYPFGDLNARVMQEVEAAGYRSARSIHHSLVNRGEDAYRVRITGVTDAVDSLRQGLKKL